jgi:hypothetical protein
MNTLPQTVPPVVPPAAAGRHGQFLAVSIQDYEALASAREAFVDFLLAPAEVSGQRPLLPGTGG